MQRTRSMIEGWRRAGVAVVAALALSGAAGAAETNQCVDCHEIEQQPISLGHSFAEWRASGHARAGVTCEKCHGGDPAAKTAAKAHEGVLAAAEKDSLVNPARLPSTCGGCHPTERNAFDKTVHATNLAREGRGATCSTCHGAMATSLPSPHELSTRCAVCHDRPLEVQAALVVLASTKRQLRRTLRTVEATRTSNPDWYARAMERFHGFERVFREIGIEWHTFDTRKVLQDSRDVLRLTNALDEEAEIMARHPGK